AAPSPRWYSAAWWTTTRGPAAPGSTADRPRRLADAWQRNAAAHAASHVLAIPAAGGTIASCAAPPPGPAAPRARRRTRARPALPKDAAPATPQRRRVPPAAPAPPASST